MFEHGIIPADEASEPIALRILEWDALLIWLLHIERDWFLQGDLFHVAAPVTCCVWLIPFLRNKWATHARA